MHEAAPLGSSPLQTVMDLIHFNGGLQCSLPFGWVTVANWRRLATNLPGQHSRAGKIEEGWGAAGRRVDGAAGGPCRHLTSAFLIRRFATDLKYI